MNLNDRENKTKKTIVSAMADETDVEKKDIANKNDDETLKQQAYYIKRKHIKVIEMRLYKNKMSGCGETDKSALVRAALDKFFAEELEEYEKNKQ